jgi:hypothetical protein
MTKAFLVADAMLFGLSVANAGAAPLCRASLERNFAIDSRKAFDETSAKFSQQSRDALRERFRSATSHSFAFTNQSRRPAASHLLLVLPGSSFRPAYMLQNLERAVLNGPSLGCVSFDACEYATNGFLVFMKRFSVSAAL